MGEMFRAVTGTDYVHVPYNGTAPAIQDTMVGRTQFTFQSAPAMMSMIKSGKIRPIAVVGTRRIPWAENLPLVKDTIPDFEYMGGYMMYAPTGTPAEIVQRVNRDVERGLKAPLIAQRLFELGPVTDGGGSPQVLLDYQRAELKRWERLSKAINLQPE
jgi:tripartite-type tricarboxylate transporter receptor subunit TctC